MTQEAIPFDTHRFVQNLIAAGFSEKQAETLAYEHVNLINSNLATKSDIEALRLATKSDIEALRADTEKQIAEVRRDIETLRADTDKRIAQSKNETIKWVVGIAGAQSALLITIGIGALQFMQSAN